ncbi:hypothetical protein HMPREF1982_01134 [Clostridiales bacterium oral taxon 876 str. F0540]|nr:hypothetical protein HMPREF1982_01134 [Clostridiales bacterium oral taxon 876 str. F0540]
MDTIKIVLLVIITLSIANTRFTQLKGGCIMTILRWIGGFVVLFWLIGLIFRIGGGLINLLLIVAAVVFIVDALFGRRKTM